MSGLKQTLLAESGALTSYSHRVFSAWDFGLRGDVHVRLRHRIILYELQVRVGVYTHTGTGGGGASPREAARRDAGWSFLLRRRALGKEGAGKRPQ